MINRNRQKSLDRKLHMKFTKEGCSRSAW